MALEVDPTQTRDIAQERSVQPYIGAEEVRIGLESIGPVVALRRRMDRHPFVPPLPVQRRIPIHVTNLAAGDRPLANDFLVLGA